MITPTAARAAKEQDMTIEKTMNDRDLKLWPRRT